jgi:hypothetical protein
MPLSWQHQIRALKSNLLRWGKKINGKNLRLKKSGLCLACQKNIEKKYKNDVWIDIQKNVTIKTVTEMAEHSSKVLERNIIHEASQ